MVLDIRATSIPDVKVLRTKKFEDHRGFFSETYNRRLFESAGIHLDFVQDSHSLSGAKGTVRGLHFQIPPCAQAKLVRVIRGAVLDVVVDLRRQSSTFGHHVAEVVSAEAWNQILVPVGFAHGFCTLDDHTELLYKLTHYYSPSDERGLRWNDPALDIPWPVSDATAILSEKDRALPLLSELPFTF